MTAFDAGVLSRSTWVADYDVIAKFAPEQDHRPDFLDVDDAVPVSQLKSFIALCQRLADGFCFAMADLMHRHVEPACVEPGYGPACYQMTRCTPEPCNCLCRGERLLRLALIRDTQRLDDAFATGLAHFSRECADMHAQASRVLSSAQRWKVADAVERVDGGLNGRVCIIEACEGPLTGGLDESPPMCADRTLDPMCATRRCAIGFIIADPRRERFIAPMQGGKDTDVHAIGHRHSVTSACRAGSGSVKGASMCVGGCVVHEPTPRSGPAGAG